MIDFLNERVLYLDYMESVFQSHQFTVLFDPAPEGGFVASVPALPGCLSQGETFEEAKKNILDAIEGYLAVLKEDGNELPSESNERIVATILAPDPA